MPNCAETSGFLFQHPCTEQAGGACQRCGKPVCTRHIHATPTGLMCTTCAKQETRTARQQGRRAVWDDNPYLYDVYYYSGYGYYGRGSWGYHLFDHDFTEADGGSVRSESDSDWEHDMGGS